MTRITRLVLSTIAALLLAGTVTAEVSLNAARVGGEDVTALAEFYKSAFGLQEVNRLEFPGMLEIMLNFGDTVEEARANPNAQVVIMHRDSDDLEDPVPHLIFNVTDMDATVAAVKAAGGTMDSDPRPFGNSGMVIGFGRDPAGNRFELIQPPQAAAAEGKVLGLALVGHHVSDLDESIRFYETIGFELQEKTPWRVDHAVNKLGGTPGAESRTAYMTIQSSVSDVPFRFILREYRGIERQDWSHLSSSDLLSSHIDLTYMNDVQPVMDRLDEIGMLDELEMNMSSANNEDGTRRFAFVLDPDGWYVELFAKATPKPGDPPKVSDSTATFENIDRTGKQAGFNHYALNIIDPKKALAFYEGVLGGDYPPFNPEELTTSSGMVMLNGWFPQATTDNNLRFEIIKFPQNEGKEPPAQEFQDINIDYGGFQVENIEAVYEQARAAGATTVSEGGIVDMDDGRAVMLRDPDVGGFVMLWEPAE